MSELSNFLNWFEGFSENIEKAPTAKQWQRIKVKIARLKSGDARSTPSPIIVENPMPQKHHPTTIEEWKDCYVQSLIDLGLDAESAHEFASEFGDDNPPDLAVDPMAAAREQISPML